MEQTLFGIAVVLFLVWWFLRRRGTKAERTDATVEAQAPVPQERVSPAPRSQTRILIS